jgi:hypothetical protein
MGVKLRFIIVIVWGDLILVKATASIFTVSLKTKKNLLLVFGLLVCWFVGLLALCSFVRFESILSLRALEAVIAKLIYY